MKELLFHSNRWQNWVIEIKIWNKEGTWVYSNSNWKSGSWTFLLSCYLTLWIPNLGFWLKCAQGSSSILFEHATVATVPSSGSSPSKDSQLNLSAPCHLTNFLLWKRASTLDLPPKQSKLHGFSAFLWHTDHWCLESSQKEQRMYLPPWPEKTKAPTPSPCKSTTTNLREAHFGGTLHPYKASLLRIEYLKIHQN